MGGFILGSTTINKSPERLDPFSSRTFVDPIIYIYIYIYIFLSQIRSFSTNNLGQLFCLFAFNIHSTHLFSSLIGSSHCKKHIDICCLMGRHFRNVLPIANLVTCTIKHLPSTLINILFSSTDTLYGKQLMLHRKDSCWNNKYAKWNNQKYSFLRIFFFFFFL